MEKFTPRTHQIELSEEALTGNLILCLQTGAEKSVIAVSWIKKFSQDVQLPFSQGGKRTIFITSTELLMTEERALITRQTDLKCHEYSSDMNVGFWTESIWKETFELNQVLVMTAQFFLGILSKGLMPLNRVNLIIFDECHYTIESHPVREIMKFFENCPKNEQPKILGFTATLTNSNLDEDSVFDLENTFNAKVINALSDSAPDSERTQEDVVIYQNSHINSMPREIELFLTNMELVLDVTLSNSGIWNADSKKKFQPKSIHRHIFALSKDIREYMENQGLYGSNILVNLRINQLQKIKIPTEHTELREMVTFVKLQMEKLSKLMESEMDRRKYSTNYEKIKSHSSNKLLKLIDLLENYYEKSEENENSSCIIFVSSKTSAAVLYEILKDLKKSLRHLRTLEPRYAVGYSRDPCRTIEGMFSAPKWNKGAVNDFCQGKSNCLIATDIIDQKVNIPACSLIIRFDPPLNFRSYVQSRGRTKHSINRYIKFIEENDNEMHNTYSTWKKAESTLEEFIGTKDESIIPTSDNKNKNSSPVEIIAPYVVTADDGTQSTLTDASAMTLLNKYCTTLKVTKNVNCNPSFNIQKVHAENSNILKFRASLTLPKKCPLQEIIKGDTMQNVILAKRSAAMKACIALHKIGELNDQLLPHRPDILIDKSLFLKNLTDEFCENSEENIGHVGESHLVFAESLYAAQPMPNCEAYLHIIEVKPTSSNFFENRHWVFYNYLNDKAGFAILSNKKLPVLPSFNIFVSIGLVNVDIQINKSKVILTSSEIEKLKKFHWIIFNDILEMVRKFSVFDNENLENSFFVVPVDDSWNINWEIIEKHKEIIQIPADKPVKKENESDLLIEISPFPSLPETEMFTPRFKIMNDDEWQIVIPKYRSSQEVFIVTKVCHDMNPLSPFPSSDMMSYFDYYKQKYKLVTDVTQPLLEVKSVTRDLDFILPRKQSKLKGGKNLKMKHGSSIIYFIPELCNIITFPAMYWLKAITLPTILHRITQLLIADDLRRKINHETGLGRIDVESWPPFEFQLPIDARIVQDESFNSNESQIIDHQVNQSSLNIDKQIFMEPKENIKPVNLIDYELEEWNKNRIDENLVNVNSAQFLNDWKNQNEDRKSDSESMNLIEFSDDESDGENKPKKIIANIESNISILECDDQLLLEEKKDSPIILKKNLETIELINEDFHKIFRINLSFSEDEMILAKLKNKGYSKRYEVVPPILEILSADKNMSDGPSPADILTSMTTAMASDYFDLERLETLGDSFLKFITSTYLAERYPNVGEGQLTMCKGRIVGNQNLFVRGKSKDIPGRLRVDAFLSRGNFIAPSYSVQRNIQKMLVDRQTATTILHELHVSKEEQINGRLSKENLQNHIFKILNWQEKRDSRGKSGTDNFIGVQAVKDKCVSDCVEALTGTYLKHTGINGATEVLKWFKVLPDDLDIKQILLGPSVNPRLTDDDPLEHMPWINFIQNTIGYKFKDPVYLLQAVTHASFNRHSISTDYQRLEFLGDAVIDFLITVYIFEHCGKLSPGDLTDLRSALVNNITFACLTVKYGLHISLLHFCPHIAESIQKFEKFQTARDYLVDDDLFWILLEKDDYLIAEYIDVPKILGDIFEAIIGAIYLDAGKDLNKVWDILYGLMVNELERFSKNVPKQPVRKIFETPGVFPKFMESEEVEKMTMIPLRIHTPGGIKIFHGFGTTKAQAKRAAAKHALKYLGELESNSDKDSNSLKFESFH